MTVIVATRTQMGAYRMVSDGGEVLYFTKKVLRIRDCLVGVSGDVNNTTKFLAWFRKECPSDEVGMTLDDDKTFAGLVLTAKGELLYYADCVEPDVLDDKFAAIGAGRSYAVSAIDLGKSVAEAVQHAIKWCPGTCGGKIDVLSLVKRERGPKARPSPPADIVIPPAVLSYEPTT